MKPGLFPFLYIILMGMGYPIMRFMSLQFDPLNNNAIRSFAGGIFFISLCLWKYRSEFFQFLQDRQAILQTLVIALFLSASMYFFTLGLQKTSALSGSLFSVLAMPLAVITASFIFLDERKRVLNRWFVYGSICLLSGSFLFISGKSAVQNPDDLLLGYICLFLFICIQAVQNLFIKKLAQQHHVIVMSAFTSTFTALIYLMIVCISGRLWDLNNAQGEMIFFLFLSGIYGMLVGMLMAFYIIQKQGIVTYNILQLIIPIATGAIGYITLHETFSNNQFLGMIVIILGGIMTLRDQKTK